MAGHFRRRRPQTWVRAGGGWWDRTPLDAFRPLLSLANSNIDDTGWEITLWTAMGAERLCRVSTPEGETLAYASDLEDRPATPYIPSVFGASATRSSTKELRAKIRKLLDLLIGKARAITSLRSGHDGGAWLEAVRRTDVVFRPTGADSCESSELPWYVAYFADYREVLDNIQTEFGAPNVRSATVHWVSGFIAFDNAGKDAGQTLAWWLAGLTDVVFREERAFVRRCRFCESYFLHGTRKIKDFCREKCRFDFHNKGAGQG